MKRHLIFFLFLFVSLMEVSSHDTSQYTDAKIHIADIYNKSAVLHPRDRPLNKFIDGKLRNYVIHTFTIHSRSTLFMANLMGTKPGYDTCLALYYRPLNSTQIFSRKAESVKNSDIKYVLETQERFGLEFDEDLLQIPVYCPVLYSVLEPGEYELHSVGTDDMGNPTQMLSTNVYLSPMGVDEYTFIDVGHFKKGFSKEIKPGTFSGGEICYRFSLDSINMISVVPLDTMGVRPLLKMATYFQL